MTAAATGRSDWEETGSDGEEEVSAVMEVNVTTSVDDAALAVDRLAGCVADVGAWTSSSRLRLNSSKTQVMWLGHKNQVDKIDIRSVPMMSSTVVVVDSARDLGVVIDSRLTMSDQVAALCRASYYQLRQLRPVARSLPEESAKTLVQAFISCRLDYCNALLYGINDHLFRRLQSVQNAAARFLTGTSRRDHISPVLRRLHWLPVKQRVDYKLATIVSKSLRGQTPSYLVDDCQPIADSGRRQLRSADANVLSVPRTRSRLGDRSFSVAGPSVWNSLPASLRQPDVEFGQFKRLLKSFLFGEIAAHL